MSHEEEQKSDASLPTGGDSEGVTQHQEGNAVDSSTPAESYVAREMILADLANDLEHHAVAQEALQRTAAETGEMVNRVSADVEVFTKRLALAMTKITAQFAAMSKLYSEIEALSKRAEWQIYVAQLIKKNGPNGEGGSNG